MHVYWSRPWFNPGTERYMELILGMKKAEVDSGTERERVGGSEGRYGEGLRGLVPVQWRSGSLKQCLSSPDVGPRGLGSNKSPGVIGP